MVDRINRPAGELGLETEQPGTPVEACDGHW